MEMSQKAYVLHVRPYTDSRLLIDFLTERSGLVRTVGRSPARRNRSCFQSFQRLDIELQGRSELKSLRFGEPDGARAFILSGKALFCGLYANELMQRLLAFDDACPEIFLFYELTLARLMTADATSGLEAALRDFEFFLLGQLGFGIQFDICADTETPVSASEFYYFEVGVGLRHWVRYPNEQPGREMISGADLLAIACHDFTNERTLKSAKRISRQALQPLLGSKPLVSKELFR